MIVVGLVIAILAWYLHGKITATEKIFEASTDDAIVDDDDSDYNVKGVLELSNTKFYLTVVGVVGLVAAVVGGLIQITKPMADMSMSGRWAKQ